MNKIILLVLNFTFFVFIFLKGQTTTTPNDWTLKWSGYVKTEYVDDSRKTVGLRQGEVLFYPDVKILDKNGNDINATPSFNMMDLQSRLRLDAGCPDVLGAKSSGFIEAEFLGSAEANINSLRLRHAVMKLNWKHTELFAGQFWHPMVNIEAMPATVSFNTGSPFMPFTRVPQIRITETLGSFSAFFCISSQLDMVSIGPNSAAYKAKYDSTVAPVASTAFIMNTNMPSMHLQFQYRPDSTAHFFAIGADIKTLRPELYQLSQAGLKYQTNTTITSLSAIALIRLKFNRIIINTAAVYTQNGADMNLLGGYAVKKSDTSGNKSYTNIASTSEWIDIKTAGKKVEFGIFAGYSKLLGSSDQMVNAGISKLVQNTQNFNYSFGKNIDHLYRISPRVVYRTNKLTLGCELEYTVATYGTTDFNDHAKIINTYNVGNLRFIATAAYLF